MATVLELARQKRADLIEQGRDCQKRQEALGKKSIDEWDANEREKYTTLVIASLAADDAYNALNGQIVAYNRMDQLLAEQELPEGQRIRQQAPNQQNQEGNVWGWNPRNGRLKREAFRGKTGTTEYTKSFNRYLRGGPGDALMASTGMSTDNEERGGVFQTSEQFMTEVIKQVDDAVFVQGLSRVIMMPAAKSLGVRTRRARASTFTWAGENTDARPQSDTSLLYGKRLLTPNYLQGSTIISRDLIRAVPNAEGMVVEEIGVDLNYKLEPAFLFGDGNQKPMGLMISDVDGIGSSRDFTSTKAASFTFDDFTNLKYSLKGKYRHNATFMLHRFVINEVALLKDGNGRYLWEPSRQVNMPDLILGSPVVETEWMPSAKSSSQYYALFGDFSYYWIVYEMAMEMQRLNETRAMTNEYEYVFRCKLDAQPMLEEAFSRGVRA